MNSELNSRIASYRGAEQRDDEHEQHNDEERMNDYEHKPSRYRNGFIY